MSGCYINLTLVGQHRKRTLDGSDSEGKVPPYSSSPFSLKARLSIETPSKEDLITLPTLFSKRKQILGFEQQPRRILIRGRAGVGKTTLCKKIVHDFTREGLWQDLFQRVIWIPLRKLKKVTESHTLNQMLKEIFFWERPSHDTLHDALAQHIDETESCDTLFLLDGLDEVAEIMMERRFGDQHFARRFLINLLNRPNVVITARPQAAIPYGCQGPDMDLDTIGFNDEEVKRYIDAVVEDRKGAEDIKTYLGRIELLQSLARIPIQLDALCFTWKSNAQGQASTSEEAPRTMTSIYTAITQKLWIKDIERHPKPGRVLPENPLPFEIEECTSEECEILGRLAFSGLHNNVIEFQERHRNTLLKNLKPSRPSVSLDTMFGNMSFLRSSNPVDEVSNQSFHFIHLTFQEYFAAKYFVQRWQAHKDLQCVDFKSNRYSCLVTSCEAFIQQHKYDAQYHIMWRFVTGLMNDDGEDQEVERFLQTIEQEPVDLLGPAHQRLVMQCLSETFSLPVIPIRSKCEQRLKRWILFELSLCGHSALVSQLNFPASVLEDAFRSCSDDEEKMKLLDSVGNTGNTISETTLTVVAKTNARDTDLRRRAVHALDARSELSESTLAALTGLLRDEDMITRNDAVRVLRKRSDLPESTLAVLTGLLSDGVLDVRYAAVQALGRQLNLPESTLAALTGLLSDEDAGTRKAAVRALGERSDLPESTLAVLTGLLSDKDWMLQRAAAQALDKQSNLPASILVTLTTFLCDPTKLPSGNILAGWISIPDFIEKILNAVGFLPVSHKLSPQPRPVPFQAMKLPYEILVRLSFRTQLSLYYEGNHVYINRTAGVQELMIEGGQCADFEDAIKRGRKFLSHVYKYSFWI
jgi:hypothetical protein